jgi:hypothetical protein
MREWRNESIQALETIEEILKRDLYKRDLAELRLAKFEKAFCHVEYPNHVLKLMSPNYQTDPYAQ